MKNQVIYKKLLFILLSICPILGMAQFDAGDYINSDTIKKNGTAIYVDHLKLNHSDIGKYPQHQGNKVGWVDLVKDSLFYLDFSYASVGDTVLNSGETYILFDVPFRESFTDIEVVAYVRRNSDNAVVDYVISDISHEGFKITLWDNSVFVGYIAHPRIDDVDNPDSIFKAYEKDPKYAADSNDIKRIIRHVISDSINLVHWHDTTATTGAGIASKHDVALKQEKLSLAQNYISVATGTSTLGNSLLYQNGNNIGLGTTTAQHRLAIIGNSTLGNNMLNLVNSDFNKLRNTHPQSCDTAAMCASITNTGKPQFFMRNNLGANVISVDSNGYVGINTSTVSNQFSQKSTTALESAPLGNELLSSSNWTSTNWTGDFSSGFTHTTGNTTALTNTLAAVINNIYQIAFTVTGRTAGTFTVAFGGVTNTGLSATGTWGPKATSTESLSIAPTTDFNGTIVISIKQITGVHNAIYAIQDNTGSNSFEIRNSLASLNNLFVGKGAGRYSTTGNSNTASGVNSLYFNTTGNNNTASGAVSLYFNTIGSYNTAQGVNSLYSNTTGNSNTASGVNSLYFNTTGNSNTASGVNSLYFNTTGNNNTASGDNSLNSNTIGNGNAALGRDAGRYMADGSTGRATGNNGLYLGYLTKASADGTYNENVIGYNATGLGSNTIMLGNTSITKVGTYGEIYKSIEQSKVPGIIFTQTASKTVANTTTETSLLSTGSGSLTLPANCLIAGKTIRLKLSGYLSSNNGVSSTVKVKLGSTEIVASTGTTPKAFSNTLVELTFVFTCRTTGATGTIIGQGGTIFYDGVGITTSYVRPLLMTATATINTTVSNALDVTYKWTTADAGNTITCTLATIEILN